MFTEGFDKTAGWAKTLKGAATAGLMAVSGGKAHAQSNVMDALKTTGRAAQSTEAGKAVSSKANEYLKKAQNVTLLGRGGGSSAASVRGGAGKSGGSPNLSIRDGNRLNYEHGKFEASVGGHGEGKAKYQTGKNWSVAGEAKPSGERKIGVFFSKEF